MNITLTQDFGIYSKDSTVDLPQQVAETMIRAGVATDGEVKQQPPSKAKAYRSKVHTVEKAF